MKSRIPVPRRALVLGIAIGLAILGFAGKLLWDLRVDTWNNAVRSNGDVVASVSNDIERNLQVISIALQGVVDDLKTPGVLEMNPDLRNRILFDRSLNGAYLGAILVLDSRGNVFLDSRNKIAARENYGTHEFFANHRDHPDDKLYVGHPFKPPGSTDYFITLSRRLEYADGAFSGVVVGTMSIAYFRDLFSKINLGANSGLTLTLADGTMVMRFPYSDKDVGRNVKGTEVFDRIVARRAGSFIGVASIDGVERQYVFRQIEQAPLYLTAAQATDTILENWRWRAGVIALLTATLLAACGTLALILSRELVRRDSAETSLFAESERLRVTLRSIGDAVLTTDVDGKVLYMNPVAERMSGWTIADALGKPSREVLRVTTSDGTSLSDDPIALCLQQKRAAGVVSDSMLEARNSGARYAIEDSAAPIRDRDGAIIGAVMVFRDVSAARAVADRMSHLAQHDALTNLPNRVLLGDRLSQAIERDHRNGSRTAVLFVDLDRFKEINDSRGHIAGDRVLVDTAHRLQACIRHSDTVCRHGGDEFVILLCDLSDAQSVDRIAAKILQTMTRPFDVDGAPVSLSASIGVAIHPQDGRTVDELLRNADAAMYRAKQSGRNARRFFDPATA